MMKWKMDNGKWIMAGLVLAFSIFNSQLSIAATYYVAASGGDNSRNCTQAQSIGTPLQTMTVFWTKCAASIVAGDTVNIRTGTYSEALLSNGDQTMPASGGGTDWGSNAVTIQAYNNEAVTFTGTSGRCINLNSAVAHYYIFKGIIFDGCKVGANTTTVNHIKLDNMEIKNVNDQCIDYYGSYLWVTRSRIHDCIGSSGAPNQTHALYVEGPNALVENNEIYNIPYGFGVHNYGDNGQAALSNGIYRNNYLHHIGVGNTGGGVACMILSEGADIQVYNNICAHSMGGITTFRSPPRIRILNNTFYDIGSNIGSGCSGFCTVIYASGSDPRVQNNLIWTTNVNFPIYTADATGSNIINSNNTTSNPFFQNAGAGDFRLTSASTGQINTGADLSAFFTTDYAGTPRTIPFDIGAYEYIAPVTPTNQLVLALPLDEGTGPTAVDVSGQKNNAALASGATWDNTGMYGKAIMFDGTGYLNIPASASLALAPAMTLEAWVYPTVDSSLSSVFRTVIFQDRYYLYASSEPGYCPTPSGASGGGYSAASTENYICATTTLPINQWSHLAVTQDGVNTTFYLNGNPVSSKTATELMVPATANVTIGASAFGEYFTGKMDQVMVYNYARTRPQVLSDMNTALIGGPGKYVEIAAPASVEISAASSLEIAAD